MFSSRLPIDVINAIESRAAAKDESKTEALSALVRDSLDMHGRDGLESRLAAAQAVIDEQERMLSKRGKRTPRTKRLGVSMTLAEAATVDRGAHAAGMSRADYIRQQLLPDSARTLPRQQALPNARRPALPTGK